jgi:hypothetical protein
MELENIGKIFLLGDLHIGVRNNSIEWATSQKEFLIDYFCKEVDRAGFNPETDILIQEGDWFHNREHTNNRIWNDSLEIFSVLSKKFKRGIYIILGNHDVYYKDNNSIHSLKGVEKIFSNIHVFEKPEILTLNSTHRFLMLPWIEDEHKISNTVSKYISKAEYIVCHADIKDFKLNKWIKLQTGLELNLLKNFVRVYSGHIHIHQENGNVLYTGTPFELDRGDRGNPKGFYVLELTTKNGKPHLNETFKENIFSPKFIKLDAFDLIEMKLEEIKNLFENNYVDIMMRIDKASSFPVTRFMEILDTFNYKKVEFFTYNLNTQNLNTDETQSLDEVKDYDIYEIFLNMLEQRNYSESYNSVMKAYFKKLNDKIKNKEKNYE